MIRTVRRRRILSMTEEEFIRFVAEYGPDEVPPEVPLEWFELAAFQEACDRWELKTAGGMKLPEFLGWVAANPFDPLPPDTPPGWLRLSAYQEAKYDWLENIERSIRKIGRIWVSTEGLRNLASKMTVEQQVEFYNRLRRRYPGREREFRPDFENGFPDSAGLLPAPLTGEQARAEVCRQADQQAWAAAYRQFAADVRRGEPLLPDHKPGAESPATDGGKGLSATEDEIPF
jgi:hypothetical protein